MAAGAVNKWRRIQGLSLLHVLLAFTWMLPPSTAQLTGAVPSCENEGGVVDLPILRRNPCIKCVCKNRKPNCQKQTCSSLDDCSLIVTSPGVDCCERCKVCSFNGDLHPTGDRWRHPMDSCQSFECQEGVVTASISQCEPSCKHPFPKEGSCCPVCPGCILNGVYLENGETSVREDDPCVECTCEDGNMSCTRMTCPVLSCPIHQSRKEDSECCPKCVAQRRVYDLRNRCLFGSDVFDDGDVVFQDECTRCTCLDATVMCQTTQCPTQYNCHRRDLVRLDGECCAKCPPKVCIVNGTIYQNGDSWKRGPCSICQCVDETVRCAVNCSGHPQSCDRRHVLQIQEGECCPTCMEKNGICTVFGDPHYRTFDARLYNFQGRCKYLLTADCKDDSFRIRVKNDGRDSQLASWSKTVFIHVGGHTITLRQGKRVRVNRTDIVLPFISNSVGKIFIEDYAVTVSLNIGVQVLWDGDSFIRVSVSPKYKNNLCGLCGNYNGDRHDDFRTFDGLIVDDVNAFATSWRIGSKGDCDERATMRSPCKTNQQSKMDARKECRIIKSAVFAPCRGVVKQWLYYRTCLTDVCECGSSNSCSCEAILAYIRECERHGVQISYRPNVNCV